MAYVPYFNTTNATAATNPLEATKAVIKATNYVPSILTMIGIFVVLFLIFKGRSGIRSAFAGAAFLTTVVSFFLSVAGLLPDYIVMIFLIMTVGGAISLLFITPEF